MRVRREMIVLAALASRELYGLRSRPAVFVRHQPLRVRLREQMTRGASQSRDRGSWDERGARRLEELSADPGRFFVSRSPHAHKVFHGDLMTNLVWLAGLEILEIGCGRGDFSVYLQTQGARVTGIDVSENSLQAARKLAEINGVDCRFVSASATDLPFDDASFDRVVGIAVLHHLPKKEDVVQTLHETRRVLRPDGSALFCEPIENSRAFDFIQNLIPRGGGDKGDYRPSILRRRAWAEYRRRSDERSLSERELVEAGSVFPAVTIIRHYGLLARLWRLLGRRSRRPLEAFDGVLLRALPPLRYLSRIVLVQYGSLREAERARAPLAAELHDRAVAQRKEVAVEDAPPSHHAERPRASD
jgi:2-polyprenyl-3-methyl-5-hydroxy-6-metoxy-1,4-benzoquinol methylase